MSPHQLIGAIVVIVVVLLALVGLYYYLARSYAIWLPYQTKDCPPDGTGKQRTHHLVYVNDVELGMLKDHAEHPGKPCHGIRSFPKAAKAKKGHGGNPYWFKDEHGRKIRKGIPPPSMHPEGGETAVPAVWGNEPRRRIFM